MASRFARPDTIADATTAAMARPLPRSDGDIPITQSVRQGAWVTTVAVVTSVDALDVPWWLLSCAQVQDPDESPIIPARWRKGLWGIARSILDAVPVGDATQERGLQMNGALWVVRATTASERAAITMPDERLYPVQLLGGPVRELWRTGVSTSPTAAPCRTPRRAAIARQVVRVDCGTCGPCTARRAVEQTSADDWIARRPVTP